MLGKGFEILMKIHASLVLPIAGIALFGGLGVLLLITGIVKGISIIPGIGLITLGLVFYFGIRAYTIELTAAELIYKELGRKRKIPIAEIAEIHITEGFSSLREMFAKPSIRMEIRHISDESKNINIVSSMGIFHPRAIRELLTNLRERGILITES
jgi:hypothetical protein